MTWATGKSTGSGKPAGFTLLELLVVLAILVLFTAAMPFAFSQAFPRQQLRVAARDLATQLRSLRADAVDEGRATEFTSAAFDRTAGMTLSVASESEQIKEAIRFYPDGSATGGELTLSLRNRTASLRVSALTGRVEVGP